MATTRIVLLSDSTNGWFWDGQSPDRFFPEALYGRYGATIITRYNGSYTTPAWSSPQHVWFGGSQADVIELWNNGVGGANWDDIDAPALQATVTDINPDIVIVALGINGGSTGALGLDALIEDVQAAVPAATIVLLSQNPVVSHNGGDDQNRNIIAGLAQFYGLLFVDVYQEFIDYGEEWFPDLVGDGVHPTDAGKQVYSDTVEPAMFEAGLLGPEQEESTVAVLDDAELVLRAHRYSGSGVWLDESGNGHHATYSAGSPVWDGEKFTFGNPGEYFVVADADGLDPGAGDFTVVAVCEPTGVTTGRVVAKRVGGQPFWDFPWDGPNSRFQAAIGDGTDTQITSMLVGSGDVDVRVVAALRLIRSTDLLQVRVDDVTASNQTTAIDEVSSPQDLIVGGWGLDSTTFPGHIYGVAIFPTALSDQQIAEAGNALIPRELAGSMSVSASLAGAMSKIRALAGTVSATATVTGDLVKWFDLAVTVGGLENRRISRHSLEFVSFPLSIVPPLTLTHEVAVVPVTTQPADWYPADYHDGNVLLLVSASIDAPAGGTVTLSVGRWSVWWRARSTPEYPARLVGEFAVF